MQNESTTATPASPALPALQVYMMAGLCLLLGLVLGHLMRRSQFQAVPVQTVAAAGSLSRKPMPAGHMPTLDDMKRMADKQAAPLLDKLKSDPKNSALLVQIAAIYHGTHQFREAANYYARAIELDPKNVAVRTKLASSLYRSGDVDGSIAELNRALTYDPKDANSLFNLGMIRLQGKGDGRGAVTAWQRLLKSNPQLSADLRAEVQKLMADVMTTLASKNAGSQNTVAAKSMGPAH